MARYDTLAAQLQNTIYTNVSGDISGNVLRDQLVAFINTLGKGSNFMGILTDSNKPTSLPDGKQFYIGYNNSATALSVNLTAVGLGTLSITRTKIYVVYCDDNGWSAVDIASGLSALIPSNVNQLAGYSDLQHKEGFESEAGLVTIPKLKSNTTYYIKDADDLKVLDYDYDVSNADDSMPLHETYLFVYVNTNNINVSIPAGSLIRDGDTLSLAANKTYLITVKYNFWKVELYA